MATTVVQLPALLLNSPFGGKAWANVSLPAGFVPGDLTGVGTLDENGGADWAGFQSNVSVYSVANETRWGAGPNARCSSPFEVDLVPIGNPSEGLTILNPGNVSDSLEPRVLFPGTSNSIYFSNGFESANMANISTCGESGWSTNISSNRLTLEVQTETGGKNFTAAFQLPIVRAVYHYWFPANGTWNIDNLSEVGGPGGGWAFSYAPCP
ncbi:MAG TPA: hypothetical protein VMG36_05895 [Thermoplasmata archaeon]|nr:hypothetical protein [Thermoplasmata archaeon]